MAKTNGNGLKHILQRNDIAFLCYSLQFHSACFLPMDTNYGTGICQSHCLYEKSTNQKEASLELGFTREKHINELQTQVFYIA